MIYLAISCDSSCKILHDPTPDLIGINLVRSRNIIGFFVILHEDQP